MAYPRPVEKCTARTVLAHDGAVVLTDVGGPLPLLAVEGREQDRGLPAHWWYETDAGRRLAQVLQGAMLVWGLEEEVEPRLHCRWLVQLTAELVRLKYYSDLAQSAILVHHLPNCLRSASRRPGCD